MVTFLNRVSFGQNAFIFKGGTADGWVSKNYIASSTNIFKGGTNDGWSAQGFQQNNTNLFKGGTGDGWDSKNFVQVNTVILKGGNGDGWSSLNKIQVSTLIHKGGIGDGWASTYRPQGPLPITLLSFTAQKQGITSWLQWKTIKEINSAYFDVERSSDAINFYFVSKITAAGNSASEISYSFIDNNPLQGVNYYRLKQVDVDGHYIYSPARQVRFDQTSTDKVSYYPNPTHGILMIAVTSLMQSEQMVINVSDVSGVVIEQFKREPFSGNLVKIDMRGFAKGVYFIQVKTNSYNGVQRIIVL